ncbi:MGMT family protein [Hydrotalea flava]|uniref:MGMT family protein n=1 Tax=Hydrotalea flava TaxID=714549 RepID=UPI000AB35BE5|nr:MGMT family protein [Hydrotalea flava]
MAKLQKSIPIKKVLPSGKKDQSFFEQVYAIVALIPEGRVTNYGAIAKFLGTKMSARMVGWALNNAHHLPNVPAHRVVNRNGALSGKAHFETPTQMQILLEREGITVIDDCVVNFKCHFWDPSIELDIV